MASPQNQLFFITVAVSGLLSAFLIFCGHLMGRGNIRFVGTASPFRLSLELALLNLLLLMPSMLMARSRHLDNLLSITLLVALVTVPLWAALRLKSAFSILQAEPALRHSPNLGLAALGLTTCAVWTLTLLFLAVGFKNSLSYAAILGIGVVVAFFFIRGIMELVGFAAGRSYKPTLIFEDSVRVHQVRTFLAIGLRAALFLWAIAYVLYFNREDHPEWFYLPPGWDLMAKRFGLPLPFERETAAILANSLPPLAILLMGLFVARRATETISFLFSSLCLLYGLWGLDVFPVWGGAFFWCLHLLAWLFIAPVQLHFFLAFPHREELLPDAMIDPWRNILRNIYGFYVVLSPLFLFVHLKAERFTSLVPQDQSVLLEAVFRSLVAGVGIISVPLAWMIGGYVLIATWIHLGRAYKESCKLEKSSGCLWQDFVEGRAQERFPSRAYLVLHQMRWVVAGALVACLVFLVWYLVIVPFTLGAHSFIGDALGKIAAALFFIFSTVAMIRYRLFETSPRTVQAAVWNVLLFFALGFAAWLVSAVQEILTATLGGLALILLYVAFGAVIESLLYRQVWRAKWVWHRKLLSEVQDLPNFEATPENVVALLEESSPPDATAAWLLRPDESEESGFEIHEIAHGGNCNAGCRTVLEKRLGLSVNGGDKEVPSWLEVCSQPIAVGSEGRVLQVASLLEPWRPALARYVYSSDVSRRVRIALSRRGIFLDRLSWVRLRAARIALLVPLGGASLYGIYMVGTDGYGDHYDKKDLKALRDFAHALSIRVAPAVGPRC